MKRRELGMAAVLVLLVAVIAAGDYYLQARAAGPGEPVRSRFFDPANLTHLWERVALLSIFAVGEAVVIIAGGIDLAVGSVIALCGATTTVLAAQAGWPIGASVAVALAVGLAAGMLQGGLIVGLNLQPFIVTLGGMMLFRGIAETVCQGQDVPYGEGFGSFLQWGKGALFGVPRPMWVLLVVGGCVFFVMRWTLLGRYCYAVGSNAEAARLSGVPVRAVRFATYLISALLAALAGVLFSAYLGSAAPSMGEAQELYAIAAAVLGGCSLRGGQGSILGVLIGASIMHVIYNGNNLLGVSPFWQRTIVGVIILIAAVVDEMLARRRRR